MPTNILNLPAYTVQGVEENAHDYHINAVAKTAPTACLACTSDHIVRHGRNEQLIRDIPTHGKRVGIYVDTCRWRCLACGKTFMEPLPAVNAKREMTDRLVHWIGQQSLKRTFASIAEEVGIDEKTVRNVFNDYINELERTVRFETPKWMGIDEIHLIKPRGVIANIQNNTIVELLPNRNKDTVVRFLHHLEGKDRIQYVAMDMWAPYRDACRAVIPQAEIVVDKFHVVRMANDALERVRKSLRESLTPKQRRGLMHDRFVLLKRERELNEKEQLLLSGWTRNYDELGLAYRLKEDFFKIYDAESPDEAQALYLNWKRAITPEIADAFADIIRAWENWEPWILTYFDHPVTNAYTESLNSLIRVLSRLGRGYSFEALRAKILFTEGVHKHKLSRPKFERKDADKRKAIQSILDYKGDGEDAQAGVRYFTGFSRVPAKPPPPPKLGIMEPEGKPYVEKSTKPDEPEKNYGADISTLIRMIEEGKL